ncbi:XRE family transcriptional regulator [Streptomyces sp. NPDC015032]|uniref:XRE family transcriptional regulator n=1 Tax=Streptomyces sp. NPDC015032 TaxID=3364937 RepID=UPI0036F742E4
MQSKARANLKYRLRARRLAEIRRRQRRTQAEVATAMGIAPPNVSRIERGGLDDVDLPTLRDYVAALDGELRIVLDFGDHQIEAC